MRRIALILVAAMGLAVGTTAHAAGPTGPSCTNNAVTCKTGTTPDGSTWKIEVPLNWNGTLLLYSHGYEPPLGPNQPADDFADRTAADYLLAHGFALAGSSYPNTGWAVKEALPHQNPGRGGEGGAPRQDRRAGRVQARLPQAEAHDRLGPLDGRDDHRRPGADIPEALRRGAAHVRHPRRRPRPVEPEPGPGVRLQDANAAGPESGCVGAGVDAP